MAVYNDIKLYIEKNSDFTQTFRWKDKYKEPIDLTSYKFRSQFRYNYGSDKLLCTLPCEACGSTITVDNENGGITLYIPACMTSELKSYDDGLWSLEYSAGDKPYKTLISGRWAVISEITTENCGC